MTRAQYPTELETVALGQRQVAVSRAGRGTPTVVFISGAGLDMHLWQHVLPRVAAVTTVLAYDRAGLGMSDSPAQPRDFPALAAELAQVVEAAAVASPYVLVAHSVGAWIATLYADRHRGSLAGLVYLDPLHEQTYERAVAARPIETRDKFREQLAVMRQKEAGMEPLCTDDAHMEELARLVSAVWPLSVVPSIVLYARTAQPTGSNPPALREQLRREFVARLPGGVSRVLAARGRVLPRDAPQAVAEAVIEVVRAARAAAAESSKQ